MGSPREGSERGCGAAYRRFDLLPINANDIVRPVMGRRVASIEKLSLAKSDHN